jgi:hypothetical protein
MVPEKALSFSSRLVIKNPLITKKIFTAKLPLNIML